MRIKDGTGSNREAKVDFLNRLWTYATSLPKLAARSDNSGKSFIMANGGFISLTTTETESAILHIKNTSSTEDLHITQIRCCGTVVTRWKVYKNSTGGTLISDASAGVKQNLNLTSGNIPSANVYTGGDSKTATGGTMIGHHITEIGHSNDNLEGALILGFNQSIEITCTVASAGTICVRVLGYYE